MRAEITKIENKEIVEKINEIKDWFLEKIKLTNFYPDSWRKEETNKYNQKWRRHYKWYHTNIFELWGWIIPGQHWTI